MSNPEFLGADDDILALEKAWSILPSLKRVPAQLGTPVILALQKVQLEEVNRPGSWWKATGTYSYNTNQSQSGQQTGTEPSGEALNTIRINFNIGGGSRQITKSLLVVESEKAGGGAAPDLGGAIGVSKDGVAGYEVPDNNLIVDITAYYLPQVIDFAFIERIRDLIGNVNDATFLGRQVGEVMLLHVTGGGTVLDVIPLTFTFKIGKNINQQADAPFSDLTVFAHDILDYVFVAQAQDNDLAILQAPEYRYIHQVADFVDYSVLRFGT